jgi:dihydrofolate reductase
VTKKQRSRTRRPVARVTRAAERTTSTGRVHLYVGISLDGYIAASDGGLDWLNPYADARSGFAPCVKTIGAAIMGRVTYDDAVARGFSSFGEIPSYVVTHRPFVPPSPSVIPFSGNLVDLVAQIRERHSGDIWLMGGGSVTKAFHEAVRQLQRARDRLGSQ